ncbi:MAG: hypothetical protein LIO44_01245 [Eubacterium sp.]|nr:hypothetical protein [Eubacterium sp.]
MDEVNNKLSVKTGNLPFRAVKNSVFKSLFSDNKYLLQLYRTLHPEDTDVTEDDLEHKTLETVIARDILNDLGFAVRDKLLILVEAQSTLTVNILVRILMYLLRTYQNFFRETKQNLYGSKPVRLPKPELYVIYTAIKEQI